MAEIGGQSEGRAGGRSARTPGARRLWRVGGVIPLTLALLLFSPIIVNALMGGGGLMWQVWQTEPVKLVVCWENPADANPLPGEADRTEGWQRREWVRLALKTTWEREARVLFTGWQTCKDEDNAAAPIDMLGPRRPGTADENIKIQITNSGGGMNPGHGSWGDYMKSGVRLNLHCGSRDCIEYLAVHEFGHVLGLYHGEERGDWDIPGCPSQSWAPSWPWWPIPVERRWGAPDRYSIMAYCSGLRTDLSPGDIAGIQRAYQRHLPGTLLSLPGALCLSAHAVAPDGADAFGWECDEALDDQEWHYDIGTSALYITAPSNPSSRRCLDVDTVSWSDVQTWNCHAGANQQWQFQQVRVRGYGGLCLTRPESGVGALTMESCVETGIYVVYLPLVLKSTGAASVAFAQRSDASVSDARGSAAVMSRQMWRVDRGKIDGLVRLRSEVSDLCLTLAGGMDSDAVVALCGPAPGPAPSVIQDFFLGKGGEISTLTPTLKAVCLEVEDVRDIAYTSGYGGPATGQRVLFTACNAEQLTEKWSFSGHVVSGGMCLSLEGAASTNGAGAVVKPCSTAAWQNWDYYW
jgi:hypothetical protein